MDKIRFPNVNAVADQDLQALTTPGVRISGPQSMDVRSEFVISGRFVVTGEEYDRLGSSPHRNLVLTVLREPLYGSYHPLKDCLIFSDDIQKLSDAYSGWFNLDVWTYSGFRHEGIYHVRVSLGEVLSNVIETRVSNTSTGYQAG